MGWVIILERGCDLSRPPINDHESHEFEMMIRGGEGEWRTRPQARPLSGANRNVRPVRSEFLSNPFSRSQTEQTSISIEP